MPLHPEERPGLTQALVTSGWDAKVVKPQGMSSWLVAAKDPPKCQHIGVNGSLVVIETMRKQSGGQSSLTMTAKHVHMSMCTTTDPTTKIQQVSAAARITEVKCEIQAQIAAEIDAQMKQANERMDRLALDVAKAQQATAERLQETHKDMQLMRDEAAFTRQKLGEFEKSSTATTQTLVSSMEKMMACMESGMASRLDTMSKSLGGRLEEVEDSLGLAKRARKEVDSAL